MLHLNDAKAARDRSEIAPALSRRCYPHAENSEHSWCLSSSLSLSVGFSINDEAMVVARFMQQRTLFTCSFKLEISMKFFVLYQLGSRPTVCIPHWTTRRYILNQVCDAHGSCSYLGIAPKAQFPSSNEGAPPVERYWFCPPYVT